MSTSQRVSRGFHRLAVFLAAVPFIIGAIIAIGHASQIAGDAQSHHQKLACAHDQLSAIKERKGEPWDNPSKATIELQSFGCSNWKETVSFQEALSPPSFSWLEEFSQALAVGLAITLAVSVAVYGLIRAIGWVIGGFAAS